MEQMPVIPKTRHETRSADEQNEAGGAAEFGCRIDLWGACETVHAPRVIGASAHIPNARSIREHSTKSRARKRLVYLYSNSKHVSHCDKFVLIVLFFVRLFNSS